MRINIPAIVNQLPKEDRSAIINNGVGIEVLAISAQAINFEDKNPLGFYARYCKDAPPVYIPVDKCEVTDAFAPPDWEMRNVELDIEPYAHIGFYIGPKSWHETPELEHIMYVNLDDIDHGSKEWKLFEKTLAEYTKLSDENIAKRKQMMADLEA